MLLCLLSYPRYPISDKGDDGIRGGLHRDVLDGVDARTNRTLKYVIVDLAYLFKVSYILFCGSAHRCAESAYVKAGAVGLFIREVYY